MNYSNELDECIYSIYYAAKEITDEKYFIVSVS